MSARGAGLDSATEPETDDGVATGAGMFLPEDSSATVCGVVEYHLRATVSKVNEPHEPSIVLTRWEFTITRTPNDPEYGSGGYDTVKLEKLWGRSGFRQVVSLGLQVSTAIIDPPTVGPGGSVAGLIC